MDLNPYESPRPGEPFQEKRMGDSNAVLQVLQEIRDNQRELLEMSRAAMAKQQGMLRYSRMFMVVPLLIMIFPLYSIYQMVTRVRPVPVPTRTVPRAFPSAPPPASAKATDAGHWDATGYSGSERTTSRD